MIKNCRVCTSNQLQVVLELGEQRLSDFRSDAIIPPSYPLTLLLCGECSLIQLSESAPRELMYHDGYGYKSGVNEKLIENLGSMVDFALGVKPKCESWLDIASNDGTLLGLVPKNIHRVGIDPVKKFASEARAKADQIISDFFPTKQLDSSIKFDVITSIFMFYDIEEPNTFVSQILEHLKDDGLWLIQQNYLLEMLRQNTFDNISHEHIEYYSVSSMKWLLEQHGLEINRVSTNPTNGGSFVTFVSRKGTASVDQSVAEYLELENESELRSVRPFREFGEKIAKESNALRKLLQDLKSQGKRIQIYGASTRGSTIWQRAGLDSKLIECAVERQVSKIGKQFSALEIPIISEDQMRTNPPDYLLVGPWFLKDQFIEREKDFLEKGGSMIFPLPELQIVSSQSFVT